MHLNAALQSAAAPMLDIITERAVHKAHLSQRVPVASQGVLNLYLFFNIFPSHFALPLIVITLLLQKQRQHITLINLCITWIIVGLVSCALLYSGHQTGPEPPAMLCIAQASLLYAVPPMVATSLLAFVFQIWNFLVFRPGETARGIVLSSIIILPYVVYFAFAAVAATIGSQNPLKVTRRRRFFYCSVDSGMFSDAIATYAAVVLIVTIVLVVWIGVTMYKDYRAYRARKTMGDDAAKRGFSSGDIELTIRLSIFSLYILVGLSLSFVSIIAPQSDVPDMIFSTMATAVVLAFGTQRKIWRVWPDLYRRWQRRRAGDGDNDDTKVATLEPYAFESDTSSVPRMPKLPPSPGLPISALMRERDHDDDARTIVELPPPVTASTSRSGKHRAASQLLSPTIARYAPPEGSRTDSRSELLLAMAPRLDVEVGSPRRGSETSLLGEGRRGSETTVAATPVSASTDSSAPRSGATTPWGPRSAGTTRGRGLPENPRPRPRRASDVATELRALAASETSTSVAPASTPIQAPQRRDSDTPDPVMPRDDVDLASAPAPATPRRDSKDRMRRARSESRSERSSVPQRERRSGSADASRASPRVSKPLPPNPPVPGVAPRRGMI